MKSTSEYQVFLDLRLLLVYQPKEPAEENMFPMTFDSKFDKDYFSTSSRIGLSILGQSRQFPG